mmetsp:Transcript_8703/g.8817  ORF Transcript_8703/g.8817 Transcript_8703/m.8817 type:complete len:173 (+) Transcript_8703:930-1448(+)
MWLRSQFVRCKKPCRKCSNVDHLYADCPKYKDSQKAAVAKRSAEPDTKQLVDLIKSLQTQISDLTQAREVRKNMKILIDRPRRSGALIYQQLIPKTRRPNGDFERLKGRLMAGGDRQDKSLNADMKAEVHMRLEPTLTEILMEIDPAYRQYIYPRRSKTMDLQCMTWTSVYL